MVPFASYVKQTVQIQSSFVFDLMIHILIGNLNLNFAALPSVVNSSKAKCIKNYKHKISTLNI